MWGKGGYPLLLWNPCLPHLPRRPREVQASEFTFLHQSSGARPAQPAPPAWPLHLNTFHFDECITKAYSQPWISAVNSQEPRIHLDRRGRAKFLPSADHLNFWASPGGQLRPFACLPLLQHGEAILRPGIWAERTESTEDHSHTGVQEWLWLAGVSDCMDPG
jgi:hypothetical protein